MGATKQLFFALTQEIMDSVGDTQSFTSGLDIEVEVEKYLPALPLLEAEIIFMIVLKKKRQTEVGTILGLSQPAVSYRARRAMSKIAYLAQLAEVDLVELISRIPKLKDYERKALYDLFLTANQELVGDRNALRQSSVKWIFTKSLRYITEVEEEQPDKYFAIYVALLLLEKNLRLRVHHSESGENGD